jgi:protoheme IX farnesyltransferase
MLVGIATMLMSAGAATLNQVLEVDVDLLMRRTHTRPLPSGLIDVKHAQLFGWSLSAIGGFVAWFALSPLTFAMLAICHVSYVNLYTPMKRSTTLCTLAGAIPGAVPVLAGSFAAGHGLSYATVSLAGLLYMWQMPHFFSIGWLAREDYARANFKILPVLDETGRITGRACVLFAIATQLCAIQLTVHASTGPLTTAAIHTAGTSYIAASFLFAKHRNKITARRLFLLSLLVLPVILTAVIVSRFPT